MGTKITETEKTTVNPLEEIFSIEQNSTVVPYIDVTTDLVPCESYDLKDQELETQLQTLYDIALAAFADQQDDSECIEPRFKARNAEVAVQYLKTALEAVREKRELKQHKDTKTKAGTTNNNLIVSRNDIIRMLSDKNANRDTESTED